MISISALWKGSTQPLSIFLPPLVYLPFFCEERRYVQKSGGSIASTRTANPGSPGYLRPTRPRAAELHDRHPSVAAARRRSSDCAAFARGTRTPSGLHGVQVSMAAASRSSCQAACDAPGGKKTGPEGPASRSRREGGWPSRSLGATPRAAGVAPVAAAAIIGRRPDSSLTGRAARGRAGRGQLPVQQPQPLDRAAIRPAAASPRGCPASAGTGCRPACP
jgi:hypothetical protein